MSEESNSRRRGIPIESPESRRKRRMMMTSSHDLLSPINTLDNKVDIKRSTSTSSSSASSSKFFPLKLEKLPSSYTNRNSFTSSFDSLRSTASEQEENVDEKGIEQTSRTSSTSTSTSTSTPINERRTLLPRSESFPSNSVHHEHSTPFSSANNSPVVKSCHKSLKISTIQYRLDVIPPSRTIHHYDNMKLHFYLSERFLVLTAIVDGVAVTKQVPFSKIIRVQFIRQTKGCSSDWCIDLILASSFALDFIEFKASRDPDISQSCQTLRILLAKDCGMSAESIENILLSIVKDKRAFHFTSIRDRYGEFEMTKMSSSSSKPSKTFAGLIRSSSRIVPSLDSLESSESVKAARITNSSSPIAKSSDVFDSPRRTSKRIQKEKDAFKEGSSFTYVDPDFETERVKLFSYPEGEVDCVQVTSHELERLEPGIWLNDTLIDFELKFLLHQLDATLRDKVYIFNSFFYRRLSSAKMTTTSTSEKSGFDLVKSWTRKVNLFEKDFIIIPVNENLHWLLVIICYPNRILCDEAEVGEATISESEVVDLSECSDDKTEILIFDSLGLTTRGKSTAIINRLRTYLHLEAQDKLGKSVSRSKCTGHVVKVPQQENYTDCGCFVLQFVEEFFKEIPKGIVESLPEASYDLSDWFPSATAQNRRTIMKERIRLLAQDYAIRVQHKAEPVESNSSDIEEIVMM